MTEQEYRYFWKHICFAWRRMPDQHAFRKGCGRQTFAFNIASYSGEERLIFFSRELRETLMLALEKGLIEKKQSSSGCCIFIIKKYNGKTFVKYKSQTKRERRARRRFLRMFLKTCSPGTEQYTAVKDELDKLEGV